MKKAPQGKKGGSPRLTAAEREEEARRAIEGAIARMSGKREKEYFRPFLEALIRNNAIPIELLDALPARAADVGKTRFDQLYDAAMSLVFPGYRPETLAKLLGPRAPISSETKIWRVMLPERFGISHVLIRADSFQEAFSSGCDYACRIALRVYKRIPVDLTIRVMFMTEKAIRRRLDMRWANRVNKRKQLQLQARDYTPREIAGARMAALGHPKGQLRSLAKYVEISDIRNIQDLKKITKIVAVESETLKKRVVWEDPSDLKA
jgi:hypothetical protein